MTGAEPPWLSGMKAFTNDTAVAVRNAKTQSRVIFTTAGETPEVDLYDDERECVRSRLIPLGDSASVLIVQSEAPFS